VLTRQEKRSIACPPGGIIFARRGARTRSNLFLEKGKNFVPTPFDSNHFKKLHANLFNIFSVMHLRRTVLLPLAVVSILLIFSGCRASGPVTNDESITASDESSSMTYRSRTAAYQLVVTEEQRAGQCAERLLQFEARGGLHSRPHVNRATAEDRDCDMTIDHVRIPRNPDRRMFRLQRTQIKRDFRRAYYKALMQ